MSPLETQKNVLPFLSACAAIAPTFLSLGNHEWMLDRDDLSLLSSAGVEVLDNSWTRITVDGKEILIGGLTSSYVTDYRTFLAALSTSERYPRQETISDIGGAIHAREHKPETAWLSEFSSQSGYKVLLCHHPEYYPLIPEGIDLVLSGHAHGGQWRFFGHGVWAPGQGLWPRYTKGVYENRLVVSAGLSNTTWVPRIGNPCECAYLENR